MDKQYWQQRWRENKTEFDQAQPNVLLQRYCHYLNVKPSSRIFVPLCGKSIDMIWLAKQGYEVVGVELSQKACESFFEKYRLKPTVSQCDGFVIFKSDMITILSGDFFSLNNNMPGKIDAVYDRAALVALPDTLRQQYSMHLAKLIAPSIKILLITTSYNQHEMPGPPFSVGEDTVDDLFRQQFKIQPLYSKDIINIPDYLKDKGLREASEQVYLLEKR